MSPVFASLLPVFLLIVTGAVAQAMKLLPPEGWKGLEQATYYLFIPATIVTALAKADLGAVPVAGVATALIVAILTMAALLFALRPILTARLALDGPGFTSLFQGATRWNSFVALAAAGALYGQLGLTLTALSIAAMVPLLNVLAVVVLQRYAQEKPITLGPTLKTLIQNPFIWSSLLGLALNLLGAPIPKPLMTYGELLGAGTIAAGLILVGAGLDVKAAMRPRAVTWISAGLKLFLMPLIATLLAYALGVGGVALAVTALSAAMPTASGSYILARQMGGDAPLMAEILTVQTLAAMATIPLVMLFVA